MQNTSKYECLTKGLHILDKYIDDPSSIYLGADRDVLSVKGTDVESLRVTSSDDAGHLLELGWQRVEYGNAAVYSMCWQLTIL